MPDFTRDAERSPAHKVALRNQLITARKRLSAGVRHAAAASVQASTVAWVRREQPTVCAAYVPLGSEPGGPGLIPALAELCTVLLPVLLPNNDLDWAPFTGDLRRSDRGLLEPTGPGLGAAAISGAALILVPALAVDRHTGIRLGRGGGSYDRALARVTSGYRVALLHDGELLEHVPAEPHDRPVDAVVTPADGLSPVSGWTK